MITEGAYIGEVNDLNDRIALLEARLKDAEECMSTLKLADSKPTGMPSWLGQVSEALKLARSYFDRVASEGREGMK